MLGPTIDKLAGFKFQDISLGKSLLYFLGLEFAKVFTVSLEKFKIPALATGAGMAYAVRKVGVIRRFLGEAGSDVVSITMLAGGADEQFDLGEKVDSAIARLAISAGVMEWQEAVHKRFIAIEDVPALGVRDAEGTLITAPDAAGHAYTAWRAAKGLAGPELAAPELAAPEVAAPAAVASPAIEAPVSAVELAAPSGNDLGAPEEYLTSVERKIRAIAEK